MILNNRFMLKQRLIYAWILRYANGYLLSLRKKTTYTLKSQMILYACLKFQPNNPQGGSPFFASFRHKPCYDRDKVEEGETVLTTSKDFNPVFKELKEAIKKGSDLLAIQSLFFTFTPQYMITKALLPLNPSITGVKRVYLKARNHHE